MADQAAAQPQPARDIHQPIVLKMRQPGSEPSADKEWRIECPLTVKFWLLLERLGYLDYDDLGHFLTTRVYALISLVTGYSAEQVEMNITAEDLMAFVTELLNELKAELEAAGSDPFSVTKKRWTLWDIRSSTRRKRTGASGVST
jgi:hypothetical protein